MSLEASCARSRGNAEMPDTASTSQPLDDWENEGGSFTPSAAHEIRGVLNAPFMQAQPVDARPRSYLLHALKGALNGAELSVADLEAAIMNPENLIGYESDAWEQLHHWANEADVRARDKNYTDFHLDWLRDLHSKLAQ
jgi:hypothetical protein